MAHEKITEKLRNREIYPLLLHCYLMAASCRLKNPASGAYQMKVRSRQNSLATGAVAVFVALATAPHAIWAQDFGAIANGNWSDASTWTPAGGPPGATDSAFIGTSFPAGSAAVATVSLTGNQMVDEVHLGRNVGTNGTLNLSGQSLIVADLLTMGEFGGVGTINHGGGILAADRLRVANLNTFTFEGADSSNDLTVRTAALVTTAASGNVIESVAVFDANSQLTLGDTLVVTGDIDIRGSAGTPATLQAAGNHLMARDIFIGRFGNPGQLLNDGAITATRDLEVSGGTFTLDGNDTVTDTVAATVGGTLTLDSSTAADNGLVSSNATLNTVATGNISRSILVNGSNGTLNLGAALSLNQDLDIRGLVGVEAQVQANGHDITARDIFIGRFGNAADIFNDGAITATRNLEVSGGTFSLDANDSVASGVSATAGGTLTLHPNTAALDGATTINGTLNTVVTGNISRGILMNGSNGTLNMGADLVLTDDLDIRGTSGMPSTVEANGNDITARDIYIGRFGNPGDIVNDAAITATRNLEVSGGTFTLDANDSVASGVSATAGGTMTLHPNTAAIDGATTINATFEYGGHR